MEVKCNRTVCDYYNENYDCNCQASVSKMERCFNGENFDKCHNLSSLKIKSGGYNFLHSHPNTERILKIDTGHVIVDRDDWEAARKIIGNLPLNDDAIERDGVKISSLVTRLSDTDDFLNKEANRVIEDFKKMPGVSSVKVTRVKLPVKIIKHNNESIYDKLTVGRRGLSKIGKAYGVKRKWLGLESNSHYRERILNIIRRVGK